MGTPQSPRDPPKQTLELSTGPFSYTDEGSGPVLVAVHGLPGSARDYRWLGAALPGTVRFVRLDMPGFGGTPRETAPQPDVDGRGHFIAAALDALKLERCVLMGHSMGGGPALSAAVQSPRVAALALLASVGLRPHLLYRRFLARSAVARAVDAPLVRQPTLALLKLAFKAAGFPSSTTPPEVAHTVRCVAALDFETQARNTAALKKPALLAWADDDAFIERPIFDEHAAAIAGSRTVHWATGGHNIQKTRALELAEALVALAQASAA